SASAQTGGTDKDRMLLRTTTGAASAGCMRGSEERLRSAPTPLFPFVDFHACHRAAGAGGLSGSCGSCGFKARPMHLGPAALAVLPARWVLVHACQLIVSDQNSASRKRRTGEGNEKQ